MPLMDMEYVPQRKSYEDLLADLDKAQSSSRTSNGLQRRFSDAIAALQAELAAANERVAYLEAFEITAASHCRERVYQAISAWTSCPDTACSRATEAVIRIVNDSLPRVSNEQRKEGGE